MNKIERMLMAFAVLLPFLTACVRQPEFIEVTELGCAAPEIVVDAAEGSVSYVVIASSEVTAEIIAGGDWASLSTTRWTGDNEIEVSFTANPERERKADIRLTCGRRELFLSLIQGGAEDATFHFTERNVTIPFENGAHSAQFETVIPVEKISGSVIYPDGGDWIEEPLSKIASDHTFIYAVRENLGDTPRTAIIELTSTDNVGRALTARLYVTQGTRGDVKTIPLTVGGLRSLAFDEAAPDGSDLDADGIILKPYALTGRVISDNSEGNAAPNENMSVIIQDLTLAGRTVYLQSAEAGNSYGVKLIFDSEDALSLKRYDLATVSLKGRKLIRHTDRNTTPSPVSRPTTLFPPLPAARPMSHLAPSLSTNSQTATSTLS